MARKPSPEIDDELFNEVYGKEYTGPPRVASSNIRVTTTYKRPSPNTESGEEDGLRDPNAVPTDFTSREAKFWEAKAKATERNWKKRKEEEMICKICGESGHFTQGCPSTLGASRRSADFFERVPARDKNVRALFSEKVISQIEKDVGCKIKMDEKFLFVHGKDRLILAKGVDAVHKVIQEGDKDKKVSASSRRSESKSPEKTSAGPHLRRSESQKSHSTPRNMSRYQTSSFNNYKGFEDHIREDLQKLKGSPHAYANDRGRGRSARSKSPLRKTSIETFRVYDGHNHITGVQATDRWNPERSGTDIHPEHKFDYSSYPQTLEALELEFNKERMELGRVCDKAEDEENYKHRECLEELRENYMKTLAIMRATQAKQWEEFFQLDVQRRQLLRPNAHNQAGFSEYGPSARNLQYMEANMPIDARNKYPFLGENYLSSRPHEQYNDFQLQQGEQYNDFQRQQHGEQYNDFQRQQHGEYGKPYGR